MVINAVMRPMYRPTNHYGLEGPSTSDYIVIFIGFLIAGVVAAHITKNDKRTIADNKYNSDLKNFISNAYFHGFMCLLYFGIIILLNILTMILILILFKYDDNMHHNLVKLTAFQATVATIYFAVKRYDVTDPRLRKPLLIFVYSLSMVFLCIMTFIGEYRIKGVVPYEYVTWSGEASELLG